MSDTPVTVDPAAPFATLTPDRVLDCVEALGLRGNGRLLALNSYENRVYRVGLEDGGAVIAKFYRAGRWSDAAVLEEHAFAQELADAEIPVVPPLACAGRTLHVDADCRFALFPNRPGRTPELDRDDTLRWVGRFLGRIHARGATARFRHRQSLSIAHFGRASVDFLLGTDFIPGDLRPAYAAAAEAAVAQVAAIFDMVGPVRQIRLHGDCHVGNILWTEAGPHFVDLDDCMMGPAVQDLWMLLAGDADERAHQLGVVLDGYEDFCDFDRGQIALIEALRTLRILHYAAWLARRWGDPAFPMHFPWFNGQRYWQEHVLTLREQLAAMDEYPLSPG
jgi:Ser/Thr protein kinase RdoA (MazF antagonist)